MQNTLKTFSFLALFFSFILPADAAVFAVQERENSVLLDQFGTDDLQEFMTLSPKEMGKRRGHKLTFKERLAVKIAKRQVRKMERKGQEVSLEAVSSNAASNINIGGFLLGFLLGLSGVLIALLIGRDLVNSALIGCAVWLALVLIIIVL